MVEDEPLVAFDTEHVLRDASYDRRNVDRVAEALPIVAGDTEIDLVLVDVNLADGTGMDVARAAQAGGSRCCSPREFPSRRTLAPAARQALRPRDLTAAIAAIEAALAGKPSRVPPGFQSSPVRRDPGR